MAGMRNTILGAACLGLAGFGGISSAAAQAASDDAALVDRGAYLARAADCMPCHTGDKSKPYAGGLPFKTPFGVMYSVNITSDPQYGIGSWTFDDFKAALHNGIRKDGAYLYPAMPFDAYTGITDDDLKALWAFVRRIQPVAQPDRENELKFPFNVRLGLLAWRELFFTPATFKPTAGKSDSWNRGAYLVEALGHCSDCHSPRNIMGAVKSKDIFTGSEVDGFYAPDIASAALAKTWNKDTLSQFLRTGSAPGKTSVFGPMAEVVHESLAYLTPGDIDAMVTYLLDSPPPKDKPAPEAASPLPHDVYARAAKSYIDNCAPCHRDGGVGAGVAVPPLAGNPAVTAAEPYNVIMAVLGGLPAGGTYGAMPSFAGRLSDSQVADLVNYVRTSWGNGGTANATAGMVAAWRATAHVPDYGTQVASSFDCPKVGGAPGNSGPDAKVVASLTQMIQGGSRAIDKLADAYTSASGDSSPNGVVDALTAAYCPVVAASSAPDWQKYGDLRRWTLQVAAAISPRLASGTIPDVPVIWAVPAGTGLIGREPASLAAKLACPANDGKQVPKALGDAAVALLGTPKPPVSGDAAKTYATTLVQQNPKARRADVANALILAYCPAVAALPGTSIAEQNNLLNSFGQQVIGTLQLLPTPTVAAK